MMGLLRTYPDAAYSLMLLLVCGFHGSAEAQTGLDTLAVEGFFQAAVEDYRNELYEEAAAAFEELHELNWNFTHEAATHLMLGKSYYKLGKYEEAVRLQKNFLIRFRNNNLADFARYNLGESYYRLGEYSRAAREFLTVATTAADAPLRSKGLTLAGHVLDNKMTLDDVQSMRRMTLNDFEGAFLTLKYAERLFSRGAVEQAKQMVEEYLNEHGNPPFADDLKRIREGIIYGRADKIKIGVLLPLSGESSESGQRILAGVKLALEEEFGGGNGSVSLTVIDNESDQVKSISAMMRFADDPSVVAVVGPMTSDNAAAAAAVANSKGLPMISPTATKDGIAGIGPYSFQANVDLTNRAGALATFAVNELNLQRFAILSPADDYGKQMTDSFARQVDALGGEVVAEMWYYGEPLNLRQQFGHIRRVGFSIMEELAPEIDVLDTVDILADTTLSDSLKLIMLEELSREPEPVDSSKILIDAIDGIFFPIQYGEIEFIAPQFAFYNLETQLLGGDNWYDTDELEKYASYIRGIIFTSDSFREGGNEIYAELIRKYETDFGKTPLRTDLFGYDCMKLLLRRISEGARTRELIAERLAEVHDFRGAAGRIDFTSFRPRVNNAIHILRFGENGLKSLGN